MIFKLDFITRSIYCIIHRCLYSLFVFFCSLISVSNKRNIETVLTLPYSYNWQRFNNKMNVERSQEYQSMGPEYVTGQINSRILELILRWFCRLIFIPCWKSYHVVVWWSVLPTTTKDILAIYNCRYWIEWLLQKFT